MTFHLVHVQPSDKEAQNLLYIANSAREQAVDLVRQKVPSDWEVLLLDESVNDDLGSKLHLAPDEVREFDKASEEMGHR